MTTFGRLGAVALALIGVGLVSFGALSFQGIGVITQFSREAGYAIFGAGAFSLLVSMGLAYDLVDRAPHEPPLGKGYGYIRRHKYVQSKPYLTPQEVLQEFRETPDAITIRCINRPILISHCGNEGWFDRGFGFVARATKTVLDSQNMNVPFKTIHRNVRSGQPDNFGKASKAHLLLKRYGLDESEYVPDSHKAFGTVIDGILEQTSAEDFIPLILAGQRIGVAILGIAKLRNGGVRFLVGDPHEVGKHSLYSITLDAEGKQVSHPGVATPNRVAFGNDTWNFVIPRKSNQSLC